MAGTAVRLALSPETECDVDEAYAWYERQRPGLGEELLSCIEAALESIRRDPKLNPVVHDGYRRKLVRRFPYAIFYEQAGIVVTVFGIIHTSRDPRRWLDRLP